MSGSKPKNRKAQPAQRVSPSNASRVTSSGGTALSIIQAGFELRTRLRELRFGPPVTHVYNPLEYAWDPYENYLKRYANSAKQVVFLGMNPGPFGMSQTGVPFGEISAVRDWLGITGKVEQPATVHAKRPVTGFDCRKSEVSGRRLWGLFANRFGNPETFFREHMVINYCPLAFMESSSKNRTPDKLPPPERHALFTICDAHLRRVVQELNPQWLIGVGGFAADRAREALGNIPGIGIGQILHPSPASPAANRDWAGVVTGQMEAMGAWKSRG